MYADYYQIRGAELHFVCVHFIVRQRKCNDRQRNHGHITNITFAGHPAIWERSALMVLIGQPALPVLSSTDVIGRMVCCSRQQLLLVSLLFLLWWT